MAEIIRVNAPAYLSAATREAFKSDVSEHLASGALVVIDCSSLGALDSFGLGALVGLARSAEERGSLLLLDRVHKDFMAMFELTHWDSVAFCRAAKPEAEHSSPLKLLI